MLLIRYLFPFCRMLKIKCSFCFTSGKRFVTLTIAFHLSRCPLSLWTKIRWWLTISLQEKGRVGTNIEWPELKPCLYKRR
jgi:hypothetical protein